MNTSFSQIENIIVLLVAQIHEFLMLNVDSKFQQKYLAQ